MADNESIDPRDRAEMRQLREELHGVGDRLQARLNSIEKGMARSDQVESRQLGRAVRQEVQQQQAASRGLRITGQGTGGPRPAGIPERGFGLSDLDAMLSREQRLGVERARNLQLLERQAAAARLSVPTIGRPSARIAEESAARDAQFVADRARAAASQAVQQTFREMPLMLPQRATGGFYAMPPAGGPGAPYTRGAGGAGGGGPPTRPPAPPGGPGEPPDDPRNLRDRLGGGRFSDQVTKAEGEEAARLAQIQEAAKGAGDSMAQFDARLSEATRTLQINSNVMRDRGALTTEFITAAARGQVTIRELGWQVAATTAKFGGWTAAAAAVYGALGAVQALGRGATESLQGVNLLQRVVNNVNTDQAQRNFRDLAEEFNLPIGQVVSTYYEASKAFKDQNDALDATRAALFGVKVGELDAAKAGQFATAVVRGFHLEASQLGGVINTVNALQNQFGGNFGQIAQGMAAASGAFGAAKGNYQELAAAIQTVMQVTGIQGTNAATALRRTSELAFRPERRANILEVLGVDTRDPATSITEILQAAMRKVQSGMNPLEVAKLITTPELASRAIAPLLAAGPLYQQRLATAQDPGNSAERERRRAVQSFRDQISRAGVEMEVLGSNLAQAGALNAFGGLLKTVNATLHEVNQLLDLFNELPRPVREATLYFAQIAGILAVMRRFNVGESIAARFPAIGGALERRPFQLGRAQLFQGLGDERDFLQRELRSVGQQRAYAEFHAIQASARHDVVAARFNAGEVGEPELLASQARMRRAQDRAVELTENQADLQARVNTNLEQEAAIRQQTTRRQLRGLNAQERAERLNEVARGVGVTHTNPGLERNVPISAVVIGKDGRPTVIPVDESGRPAGAAAPPQRPPFDPHQYSYPIGPPTRPIDMEEWARTSVPGRYDELGKVPPPPGIPEQDWRRMNMPVVIPGGPAPEAGAGEAVRRGNTLRENIERQRRTAEELTREFSRSGEVMPRLSGALATGAGAAMTFGRGLENTAEGVRGLGASLAAAIDPITAVIGGFLIAEASYSYIRNKVQQSQRQVSALSRIGNESPAQLRAQGQRELDQKSIMDRLQGGVGTAATFLSHLPGGYGRTFQSPDQAEDAAARDRIRAADVIQRANAHNVALTRAQITAQLNDQLKSAGDDPRAIAKSFDQAGREADVSRGLLFAETPADFERAKRNIEAFKAGLKARLAGLKAVNESVADALALATDPDTIGGILSTVETNIGLHGPTDRTARDLGLIRARAMQNLALLDRGDPNFQANRQKDLQTIQQTQQDAIKAASDRINEVAPYDDPSVVARVRQTQIARVRQTLIGGPQAKENELRRRMLSRQREIARLQDDLRTPQADPAGGATGLGAGGLGQLPGGAVKTEDEKAKQYRALKAAQENDRKSLEELRRQMHLSRDEFRAFLREQQAAQFQAEQAAFEANTGLLQSRTADSSQQAQIAVRRAQAELERARAAHRAGTVPQSVVAQAEQRRNQAQQAVAQDALKDAQANDQLATARFQAGGASQRQVLTRQLNDARRQATRVQAAVRAGKVDPDAYRDAMQNVYQAQIALNDYLKSNSDSLLKAQEALALSQTEDPIKQANIKVDFARRALAEARQSGDQEAIINAQADLNNQIRDRRNTIQQERFDQIEYEGQLEVIGKSTEIARLESLLRSIKGNRDLQRQIRLRIHELRKSTNDLSSDDLTLGNIRLPTPYEVNRAIKEGRAAAHHGVNLNSTVHMQINVRNAGDVAGVGEQIATALPATRSSLRAAGIL